MRSASAAWDSPALIRSCCTFRPTNRRTSSDMGIVGQDVHLIATHYNARFGPASCPGEAELRMRLGCGLLCLLLTGCTWPYRPDCLFGFASANCAQGTVGDNRAQQAQAQAAANAASDDAQCRSYGAEPGSPSYIQCRMNLDNQRAQVAASDRAAAVQYLLNHR